MERVVVELVDATLAGRRLEPICELYDEVFSQPPFLWLDDESELHRERLIGLLQDPTFGLVIARAGDELIGFGYGFSLAPDTTRWQRLDRSLPEDVAAEWPGRTFVLFDYAVRRTHRGQGIGRLVHDQLLGSRSEERATLTVQPTALDTKRVYEHLGWRKLGQMEGGPGAAAPVFDVFLRDRLDDLRSPQNATE